MNDTAIAVERIEPHRYAAPRPNYMPQTYAELRQWAADQAKSTMASPDFRGRPENVIYAVQWGNELGLSPLQSLSSIALINGKPSIYGDAAPGVVRASGLCEDIIETIEGEGDAMEARCTAIRKGSEPVVRTFSVADAKKAGLWGKDIWGKYPQRMLRWRALGWALRDAFPDVLRGLVLHAEAMDTPREMVDVTPPKAPAELVAGDLDAFANQAEAEIADQTLMQQAHDFAAKGKEAFRAFWGTLLDSDRDMLRPHLRTYQADAEAADRAPQPAKPAEAEDPFGLPPIEEVNVPAQSLDPAPAAPAASEPAATSTVASPGPSATGEPPTPSKDATIETAKSDAPDLLNTGAANPLYVPTPKRGARRSEWDYWERQLEALVAATQDQRGLANVKQANLITLDRLKDEREFTRYSRALALMDGRPPEPEEPLP